MIVGKTLTIHGTPLITFSNSNIKEHRCCPFHSLLKRTRYVECTGAATMAAERRLLTAARTAPCGDQVGARLPN